MPQVESPRRRRVSCAPAIAGVIEQDSGWRRAFLENLAETSSVAAAAEFAAINASLAYRLRRNDASFAREWRAALLEGYEHLEMETLHRLRAGTAKDEAKFDIANAMRIIALHKQALANDQADPKTRDEETIFASIDAKLARFRAREQNVTRMLHEEGVSSPQSPSWDE